MASTSVRTGFIKRALQREPGYPIGVTAPMFLECVCGQRVELGVACGICTACGLVYDLSGWIITRMAE